MNNLIQKIQFSFQKNTWAFLAICRIGYFLKWPNLTNMTILVNKSSIKLVNIVELVLEKTNYTAFLYSQYIIIVGLYLVPVTLKVDKILSSITAASALVA